MFLRNVSKVVKAIVLVSFVLYVIAPLQGCARSKVRSFLTGFAEGAAAASEARRARLEREAEERQASNQTPIYANTNKIGDYTYTNFSDGTTATSNRIGNTTFTNFSDGTSATTNTIGNTTFTNFSNGTSATTNTIGNTTFTNFSDGTSATTNTIGNTRFTNFSNGTSATTNRIGNTNFTNINP